jgi:uncharacterized protein (DUF58 family)
MSLQLLTLATGSLGLLLVGIFYDSEAAYFMCAALWAVMLVSFVSSRVSVRAFSWRREVADRVFEDEPFAVTLEITNRSPFPLFMVKVADGFPVHVVPVDNASFLLPVLWPGERAELRYRARAAKRGIFPLGPLQVSVSDPFGVFPRVAQVSLPGEAMVFPRPLELSADLGQGGLELRGAISGERSRAMEAGLDFYGIRPYQPGDDLRRIHWPATAHHGRLVVIEFERGTSGAITVALDTREGSEFGSGLHTTLETGVKAAASLLHWVLTNEGVGALALDSAAGVRWQQVERVHQEQEVLAALAAAQAEGELAFPAIVDWVGPKAPMGSLVVLITALPDVALAAAARWLVDTGSEVVVLVVEPAAYGGPTGGLAAAEHEVQRSGADIFVYRRGDDLAGLLDQMLAGRG